MAAGQLLSSTTVATNPQPSPKQQSPQKRWLGARIVPRFPARLQNVFEAGVVLAPQYCSGALAFTTAAGQQTANGHALAAIVYVSNMHNGYVEPVRGRMNSVGVLWLRRLGEVWFSVSF